ncbi:transcription termination/antitermination protein NusG [Ochrobactrum sp. S1502_03]|uniref:transcription termination/antitermination protein NusG n=1 Tax=Ochrobactrum sp. S1502_03 TaxID=3108451 RepID=UPI0037C8A4EF
MAATTISKDKDWYVIRTNIKCEEKACNNLTRAGYEAYLPRQRKEFIHKRTKTRVVKESALMLRYLFVAQPKTNADWFRLRRCEGVECVLECGGTYVRVSANAVEAMFLAERDMQFDDTREARIYREEEARTKKATAKLKFSKGQSVSLVRGPFVDITGIVEEVTSSGKIKVLLNALNSFVPVEVGLDDLSPAA